MTSAVITTIETKADENVIQSRYKSVFHYPAPMENLKLKIDVKHTNLKNAISLI